MAAFPYSLLDRIRDFFIPPSQTPLPLYFSNLQLLCKAINRLPPESNEFRTIRKQIFTQIAIANDTLLMKEVICLSDDQTIYRAETLERGPLRDHEGSKRRLRPLADEYQAAFTAFRRAVIQSNRTFPTVPFERLIDEHALFANQYISEFKMVFSDDPKVVQETHKEDITHYKQAFFLYLEDLTPEEKESCIESFRNREAQAMLLIPRLGILRYLKKSDAPLPAILNFARTDLESTKAHYQTLSKENQGEFDRELLGKKAPSSAVQELHTIALNATRGTQAKLSTAILQNVFEGIDAALPESEE